MKRLTQAGDLNREKGRSQSDNSIGLFIINCGETPISAQPADGLRWILLQSSTFILFGIADKYDDSQQLNPIIH
jgi:hypothetical protein